MVLSLKYSRFQGGTSPGPLRVIYEGEALSLAIRDPEGHFYKVKSLCSVFLRMCSEFSDGHWEARNRWYGFLSMCLPRVMRPVPTST